MSADYPNRAIWLAKRETPRGCDARRGRVIWNNGTLVRPTGDPAKDKRLREFAARCNGHFRDRQEAAQRKAL